MMMKTTAFLCLSIVIASAASFEFPNLPKIGLPKPASGSGKKNVAQLKQDLLEAVSYTANGKTASPETQAQVLGIVGAMEAAQPPSPNLLTDPKEAQQLDGTWYLQYTSPSIIGGKDEFPNAWKPEYASEGESKIETRQIKSKGSVSAAGISVDTSNRVVKQIIDVNESTVTNDVQLDFGRVNVGGSFRPSSQVANRAVVSFDRADISLNGGFTLKLGFLFPILAALRGGTRENGWLETTFLTDDLRIGRGNKGTMFVLTRDPDAVKP